MRFRLLSLSWYPLVVDILLWFFPGYPFFSQWAWIHLRSCMRNLLVMGDFSINQSLNFHFICQECQKYNTKMFGWVLNPVFFEGSQQLYLAFFTYQKEIGNCVFLFICCLKGFVNIFVFS